MTVAVIGANALWLVYAWMLSAIACAYLAERKGYSEKTGLATGLLTLLLGVIVWLVLPPKANSKWKMLGPIGRGDGRPEPTSLPICIWHILLVVVSAAGLVAGIVRGRSLALGAIGLTILYATAVHTLVVSQARYNLPLMPALLAGGVAGWALLLARRRDGRAAPPNAATTPSSV